MMPFQQVPSQKILWNSLKLRTMLRVRLAMDVILFLKTWHVQERFNTLQCVEAHKCFIWSASMCRSASASTLQKKNWSQILKASPLDTDAIVTSRYIFWEHSLLHYPKLFLSLWKMDFQTHINPLLSTLHTQHEQNMSRSNYAAARCRYSQDPQALLLKAPWSIALLQKRFHSAEASASKKRSLGASALMQRNHQKSELQITQITQKLKKEPTSIPCQNVDQWKCQRIEKTFQMECSPIHREEGRRAARGAQGTIPSSTTCNYHSQ